MTDTLSSMTCAQFCERNQIGRTKFTDMNRKGIGPRMMDLDGAKRISIEAEAKWRREREEAARSPEAVARRERLLKKVTAASREAVKKRTAKKSKR